MENNSSEPAIRMQDLHKAFGQQVVLNGVNLDVPRGQTLLVLGRSGTGKSVLLKLLIGLQKPDQGEIEINGAPVTSLPLKELNETRKKIGFLFQNAALYDSLTVEENVAFPLRRHSDLQDSEIRERVRELLAQVGMESALQKMPANISGGMKKRVGLARALALDPEIMLLDEPNAGLDPITAGEIDELIRDMQQERGITSVVVTHDMRSVHTIADRVAMLNRGAIVAEGTPEELKQSDDPFVVNFLQEKQEK
ncbi:MAG: ABC transporter ATP-binding protein [Acidobacteria bacterium]|nr:ABC transporter ATP-binding protein [Acidobacteriota bacterium]